MHHGKYSVYSYVISNKMVLKRKFIAVTCINSKIDIIRDDISRVLGKCQVLEQSHNNFKLPDQPYTSTTMAVTIWEPSIKQDSTMLMANFSDGWLTLVHNLGIKYGHELYRLRISSADSEWYVCSLTYYKNGKERRIIQALKDDPRWEFFQKGEPLEFEKLEYYKKRRIKDRFNSSILFEYLNASGWNLESDKMWEPNILGFFIEYT